MLTDEELAGWLAENPLDWGGVTLAHRIRRLIAEYQQVKRERDSYRERLGNLAMALLNAPQVAGLEPNLPETEQGLDSERLPRYSPDGGKNDEQGIGSEVAGIGRGAGGPGAPD